MTGGTCDEDTGGKGDRTDSKLHTVEVKGIHADEQCYSNSDKEIQVT